MIVRGMVRSQLVCGSSYFNIIVSSKSFFRLCLIFNCILGIGLSYLIIKKEPTVFYYDVFRALLALSAKIRILS